MTDKPKIEFDESADRHQKYFVSESENIHIFETTEEAREYLEKIKESRKANDRR